MNKKELEEKTRIESPTNAGGQALEEETTMVTTTPSGREVIRERLRGYNPEGVYEEDDDFYGGVGAALDERDKIMEGNSKLADVFRNNPQTASFFLDVMNGKGIYESLARNYGEDLLTAIQDGGEAAAEFDAGLAEWRKNRETEAGREAEMRSNLDAFAKEFDAWLADEGYSEEERESLQEDMKRIAEGMSKGNHMDYARAIARSRRYDSDVEAARAEGEIRGRNARIAEERTFPKRGGDGLPMMGDDSRPNEDVISRDDKWSEEKFWG